MSRRAADPDELFPAGTTAADVATLVGGRLDGRADLPLIGAASLDEAAANQLAFIVDAARAADWGDVSAGAALISEGLEVIGHDAGTRAIVVVPDASLAMAAVLDALTPPPFAPQLGVDPSAAVDGTAELGDTVSVGPRVTIGPGCRVDEGVVLHAGVHLAADVTIGADSILHANVSVRERCEIGRRVLLHDGVVIGSDGFGYRAGPEGLVKMPHVGGVVIEDDVEIGANSCVDRAMFGVTRIGAGSKIDNLVQIAHNCTIGRHCVIAALTGVSGSVTIGDGARIGGGVGIADHMMIGRGASLAAFSGVVKDVPPGEAWGGVPAGPLHQKLRELIALRKLPAVLKGMTRSEAERCRSLPATESTD